MLDNANRNRTRREEIAREFQIAEGTVKIISRLYLLVLADGTARNSPAQYRASPGKH